MQEYKVHATWVVWKLFFDIKSYSFIYLDFCKVLRNAKKKEKEVEI